MTNIAEVVKTVMSSDEFVKSISKSISDCVIKDYNDFKATVNSNTERIDEVERVCTEQSTTMERLEQYTRRNSINTYLWPVSYTHLTLPTKA